MGVEWWLRKAPDDADEPAAVPLQEAGEDDSRRPSLGDKDDKAEGLEGKVVSAGTRAWERVTMRDRDSDSTASTSSASRTNSSATSESNVVSLDISSPMYYLLVCDADLAPVPPGTLTGVVKARASTNRVSFHHLLSYFYL